MIIKRFAVLSFSSAAVMAFAFVIGAQSVKTLRSWNLMDDRVENQLMKINQDLVGAEVRRDMSVLNVLLTDGYIHVHRNGWVESRVDFLSDFESGKRIYHSIDLHNVHVQPYDKAALIIGDAHVISTSNGENKDNVSGFLAVWVQQQGAWRLAGWMTTALQEPQTP
jgi:hypothetical protein